MKKIYERENNSMFDRMRKEREENHLSLRKRNLFTALMIKREATSREKNKNEKEMYNEVIKIGQVINNNETNIDDIVINYKEEISSQLNILLSTCNKEIYLQILDNFIALAFFSKEISSLLSQNKVIEGIIKTSFHVLPFDDAIIEKTMLILDNIFLIENQIEEKTVIDYFEKYLVERIIKDINFTNKTIRYKTITFWNCSLILKSHNIETEISFLFENVLNELSKETNDTKFINISLGLLVLLLNKEYFSDEKNQIYKLERLVSLLIQIQNKFLSFFAHSKNDINITSIFLLIFSIYTYIFNLDVTTISEIVQTNQTILLDIKSSIIKIFSLDVTIDKLIIKILEFILQITLYINIEEISSFFIDKDIISLLLSERLSYPSQKCLDLITKIISNLLKYHTSTVTFSYITHPSLLSLIQSGVFSHSPNIILNTLSNLLEIISTKELTQNFIEKLYHMNIMTKIEDFSMENGYSEEISKKADAIIFYIENTMRIDEEI